MLVFRGVTTGSFPWQIWRPVSTVIKSWICNWEAPTSHSDSFVTFDASLTVKTYSPKWRFYNNKSHLKNKSGWWLNQPIWKNMSQIGHLPQIGLKINIFTKPPPRNPSLGVSKILLAKIGEVLWRRWVTSPEKQIQVKTTTQRNHRNPYHICKLCAYIFPQIFGQICSHFSCWWFQPN